MLASVTRQVSTERSKAVVAANRELLRAYWTIGRELADRESQQGWGSKVVIRLSSDIRSVFPDAKGFSPRNLRYMKSFAETRLWYAAAAVEHGWSRAVLVHQIEIGSTSAWVALPPTSLPPCRRRTPTSPSRPPRIHTSSTSSP